MKITNYIFFSFLFILLLFSVTTYINFQLSEAVNENVKYVAKSTEITKNTSRFQRNILNMVSGLRGYLLTGEKYFVESYDSAVKENATIQRRTCPPRARNTTAPAGCGRKENV